MKLDIINGLPAVIADDGSILLQDITCGAHYRDAAWTLRYKTPTAPWCISNDNGVWIAASGKTKIEFYEEENGITFRTHYVNEDEDLASYEDFIFLEGFLPERISKAFGSMPHGSLKVNEMLSTAETFHLVNGQSATFADLAALETVDGNGMIVGYISYKEYFGTLSVAHDGRLTVYANLEGRPLAKDKCFVSDEFHITYCDDVITALPAFCSLAARYMSPHRDPVRFDVPSGYCTWYYYLGDISEQIILNSIEDTAKNKESLPVKYIQIDDGWQRGYGAWQPKDIFPSGMKFLADEIKKQGFLPGLWFAPIWAGIYCTLKDEHPEYLAKDGNGNITSCLDLSVEGARQWLAEVFRRTTYDWGFKYIKLDGITSCLGPYRYSDPDFTSVKNYREMLKVINDSIPDDVFVLGCTAPFGSAVGLVDGMRVSCDIFGDWKGVCDVFNAVLNRYYYHKTFFINDADCLIIRKAENEDDECRRPCIRDDNEIRTYISVTAASGGTLMFSDKLRLLGEDQIKNMSYLFPLNTDAALPLDLMESRIPGVLDHGTRGKIRTVMLVNWEDRPIKMSIDADGCHVYEFWSKSYKGIAKGKYSSVIPAHGCEVLFITKADEPAVIATDSTLVPTIHQSYSDGKLSFTFNKKGAAFTVAASKLCGNGVTKLADGIYSVSQQGDCMDVCLDAE